MGLLSCIFFKTYFYFALFWALDGLSSFITSIAKAKFGPQIISILFSFININIGELFSGFLVLYTNFRTKRKNEQIQACKKDIKLIYNDLSLKKNKNILIFLVSILDFLGRNHLIFYLLFFDNLTLKQHHVKWAISIDILARIYFCHIILKIKLYKHHKLAIYICSIGFFLMVIFTLTIFFEKDGEYNNIQCWTYLIFAIITKIFYALEDTLTKILVTQKFILPHFLMFKKSVICFGFYLILISFLLLTSKITFSNITNALTANILIQLIRISCGFFQSLLIFNIIYIFTPIHVGFLNIVSTFYQIFIQLDNIIFIICYIICLIIIGIGTLIFTEMVIINNYGLNEYTKVGLLLKEKLEGCPAESSLSDFNEDNSEYSDSRNCSEDIIKTRKPYKTVVYNYRRKL